MGAALACGRAQGEGRASPEVSVRSEPSNRNKVGAGLGPLPPSIVPVAFTLAMNYPRPHKHGDRLVEARPAANKAFQLLKEDTGERQANLACAHSERLPLALKQS